MYKIDDKYNVRLHHPRPRFKNAIEDVLLFIADEVCSIGESTKGEFKVKLQKSIKFYPGNLSKSEKTISNWRTEITSLLGLVQYSYCGNASPSELAKTLNSTQDLLQFLDIFVISFNIPVVIKNLMKWLV